MRTVQKLQIVDKKKEQKKSFKVLIVETKVHKNSFNGKILGLTLTEWIRFASREYPSQVEKFDEKDNLLTVVREKINKDFDYTIVLMSKTPLITDVTIKNIVEYATFKNVKLCKLPTGYVIENKSFLEQESINVDSVYSQNIEEFYIVETKSQFNYAYKVLQDRINSFHIESGVEIIAPDKTYIEPFVDISQGVIIYPNNSLKGTTTIGDSVILKENNVIDNSKIGDNSCISGSVINSSVIASNVYISAFCEIQSSIVGSDSIIDKGASINNYSIDIGSKIKANEVLGERNDNNSGIG